MNEQVQEELADLRRRSGFEEEEALAFWHRRQAGALMNEKRDVDLRQELDRVESQEQLSGVDQQATFVTHVARWHAGVYEYLAALNRALGQRVLRRHYPDGRGRGYTAESQRRDQPPTRYRRYPPNVR
jgi:hypothetical protein